MTAFIGPSGVGKSRLSREFEQYVQMLVDLRCIDNGKKIWWDVRPHPHIGLATVKGRAQSFAGTIVGGESPSIEGVVVYRRTGGNVAWDDKRDIWWHDLIKDQSSECAAEPMDAEPG